MYQTKRVLLALSNANIRSCQQDFYFVHTVIVRCQNVTNHQPNNKSNNKVQVVTDCASCMCDTAPVLLTFHPIEFLAWFGRGTTGWRKCFCPEVTHMMLFSV